MRVAHAVFGRSVAALCVSGLVSCGGGYGGGDGGSASPRASLTISVEPTTITLGQSATITWSSNGAACTASGAWSGSKAASGSETVTPTGTGALTYTLICQGGGYGGSEPISTTLTVNAAGGFTQTALVSKFAGTAAWTTDPKLVNPSGIAFAPNGPVWVAGGRTSIAYDGNGKAQSAPRALPAGGSASLSGTAFGPTAIVVNATTDFIITASGKAGSAEFIYAGSGGMIGGWSRAIDPANAVTLYADTGGAVYTGLAIANNGSGNFLYATDFHHNKIDVFDASFARQRPSAASLTFRDSRLPAGYAPFGIQSIENGQAGTAQIYVTYARQMPPDDHSAAIGAGLGLVNVFDGNGKLLRRLVSAGGALNAPWGIALAPADFGALSNSLLIGNSGDGKINAYDPASGAFIGTVSDADGRPIAAQGLWGIAFGNDSNDQAHNTLFFAAGTDEADGIYGRIDLGVPTAASRSSCRRACLAE